MLRDDDRPRHSRRWILGVAILCAVTVSASAHAAVTERVGVDQDGREIPSGVGDVVLSRDGRFAFFTENAAIPASTCGSFFVRDLTAHLTTCADLTPPADLVLRTGVFLTAASFSGRFVAVQVLEPSFTTAVLLLDRDSGRAERVDVTTDGLPLGNGSAPAISADGRFVVLVVHRDGGSASSCSELEHGCNDVFLRDRLLQTTERVSVALDGGFPDGTSVEPSLTDDGRFVVFSSSATNLVRGGEAFCTRHLPYAEFCTPDVFLYDRRSRTTTKIVRRPRFGARNSGARGVIDPAGRFVDYVLPVLDATHGPLLPRQLRVYRYDLRSRVAQPIFQASENAFVHLPLSADARFIVFEDLDPAARGGPASEGLFVFDRHRRATQRVDVAQDGSLPSGGPFEFFGGISADGALVAFVSDADDLVPGDANAAPDAFVRHLK